MNDTTLDIGRIMSIVADRWKIVVTMTILAAGAAYGYVTFVAQPVFESTALVTYQAPTREANPTGGALPSNNLTSENIQTLIGNASARPVVQAAADKLDITPKKLQESVQVRPHGDASIVDFAARAGSPQTAAERANAWAEAFVADRRAAARRQIQSDIKAKEAELAPLAKVTAPEDPRQTTKNLLTQDISGLNADLRAWSNALTVSNAAQPPSAAVWPKKTMTMLAAIIIGFMIGTGIALLTARVDRRLHGDEFDDLPAPVLVRVPLSTRAPKSSPLSPSNAEPMVSDSFAGLGARIMLDRSGDGAHVVLVTSARSGEGKSSVAANLASSLALGGRRVILVDADMRRPTQDTVFPALKNRPGLSQVMTRAVELDNALTLIAPNLAAVGSGPRHSNASMLLASVAFRQMIDRLSQISEVIVIDAPPVLAVNDALAISPAADQVLVCARVGSSDLGEISEAHSRLVSASSTPQAMVLVGTERPEGYGYDSELRSHSQTAMPIPAAQKQAAPAQPQQQQGQPPRQGHPPQRSQSVPVPMSPPVPPPRPPQAGNADGHVA